LQIEIIKILISYAAKVVYCHTTKYTRQHILCSSSPKSKPKRNIYSRQLLRSRQFFIKHHHRRATYRNISKQQQFTYQGFQQPDYTVISNITEAYLPQLNINVYPNPADKQLNIMVKAATNSKALLTLTDIQGRTLFKETFQYNTLKNIDLSDIAQGSYTLIHQNEEGTIISTHQIQKVK
jgi:hypothetical protein